jgi:hypothetical protein
MVDTKSSVGYASTVMELVCPLCKSDVPLEDVDMSSESALVTPEHIQHPPEGAWYEQRFVRPCEAVFHKMMGLNRS